MPVTRTVDGANVMWADGHVTSIENAGWRGGAGYLSNYLYHNYGTGNPGPLGPGWTSSGSPMTREGSL